MWRSFISPRFNPVSMWPSVVQKDVTCNLVDAAVWRHHLLSWQHRHCRKWCWHLIVWHNKPRFIDAEFLLQKHNTEGWPGWVMLFNYLKALICSSVRWDFTYCSRATLSRYPSWWIHTDLLSTAYRKEDETPYHFLGHAMSVCQLDIPPLEYIS